MAVLVSWSTSCLGIAWHLNDASTQTTIDTEKFLSCSPSHVPNLFGVSTVIDNCFFYFTHLRTFSDQACGVERLLDSTVTLRIKLVQRRTTVGAGDETREPYWYDPSTVRWGGRVQRQDGQSTAHKFPKTCSLFSWSRTRSTGKIARQKSITPQLESSLSTGILLIKRYCSTS